MLQLLTILLTFGRFIAAADIDYDIEGHLYVLDRGGNMLVQYSANGDSIRAISGTGRGELQFDSPTAVCARRGTDVYVADYNNHRIQRFDRHLDYITTISTHDDPDETKRFGYPRDVAVTRQGDLVIVDGENRRIIRINTFGQAERTFGDREAGMGRLVDPSAVEVSDDDNIYVLDGGRIAMFDPFGSYVRDIDVGIGGDITSISIDRDTLVAASDEQIGLYDLTRNELVGQWSISFPVTAARMFGQRIVAVEGRRAVMYLVEG